MQDIIERIRKLEIKPEEEIGNVDIIIAEALGQYGHILIDKGDEMGNFLLEAEKKMGFIFSDFKKNLPLIHRQYVIDAFEDYIKVLFGMDEDFAFEIICLGERVKELKE